MKPAVSLVCTSAIVSLLLSQHPAATFAADPGCPANAKKANFDLTMKDLSGRAVKLSDYRGKVLLLDFWATWCAPCKVEIPAFIDLYKTYRARGFEVVGID